MKTVILKGQVTRFKGDGRKLGYPTANLDVKTDLKDGVYFGFADLNKWVRHPAIIFVGVPTTMGESRRRVEAYLLDIPDQDYYDLRLRLSIEYYYRPNRKFESSDELVKVIRSDEAAARQWFSNGNGRP